MKIDKRKKYNYNENYFDKIDSKDKAYWLGFIVADGYVMHNSIKDNNSTSNGLRIRLMESDKTHLEKLNENLNYNKNIRIVKNYGIYKNQQDLAEFSLHSIKMVNDLEKLGLVSGDKSCHEQVPNIERKWMKYFILGLFDGDGHISIGKKVYEIGFLSSKEMIEYIKTFLEEELKITIPYKIEVGKYKKSPNLSRLRIFRKDLIIPILDYLYDSPIYLERKFLKYKELTNCRLNQS